MLALLAVAGTTLSACAPTPEPSPTPSAAFATEDEAFAAAEEVYRAYNEAVNRQRGGDESADPRSFLTALALENDTDATRILADNGVRIVGDGKVTKFHGVKANLESVPTNIDATLCLNVSGTQVINTDGEDVTPSDRSEVVALVVTFVATEQGLKVSDSGETVDAPC